MKSNEALRAQINGQTKQVAADLDKSESTVFNYQQTGEPNPLEIVLGIIKSQPGSAIAQLVAVESGGFFIPSFNPNASQDYAILPEMIQRIADVMAEMGKSLEDGIITAQEAITIKAVLGDLVGTVIGYLDCVVKG